jgi:hypothetical protein
MYCDETNEDMNKLTTRLQRAIHDPDYVNKHFKLPIYTEHVGFGFFGDIKLLYPLHHAAAWGHLQCVRKLVEAGAVPDVVSRDGFNAIHYAIYHGYRRGEDEKNNELVRFLIHHKVKPIVLDRKPHYTKTYLIECCVVRHNTDMLRTLLECDLPLEHFIINNSGELFFPGKPTPLILSLKYYNLEAFAMLLYHGATMVWYPNQYESTLSHFSIPHFCLKHFKNPHILLSFCEIYQQFGGDLWVRDDAKCVLSSIELECSKLQVVITELRGLICNPMRLQSLCRLSIKKLMGRKYWCNVSALPLPTDIRDFLKFSELIEY